MIDDAANKTPNPGEPHQEMPCQEMEDRLILYAADELEGAPRLAVEEHLRSCAACAAALAEQRRLLDGVTAARLDPSSGLLASCRTNLAEALDEIEHPETPRQFWSSLNLGRWFTLRPAWSAAALVLLGVGLGIALSRDLPVRFARGPGRSPSSPSPFNSASLSAADLQGAGISGIDWKPGEGSAPPSVEVHLTTERPVVVRGTVNDAQVQRLLAFVVQNDGRFDSEERLDSVELLKSSRATADVRKALCFAARRDRNPAVRLKALDALRGFPGDAEARQTVIEALTTDSNPGVRIVAVNALRQMAEEGALSSDAGAKQALESLMEHDPNTYIRLQSAAALRTLGPREDH